MYANSSHSFQLLFIIFSHSLIPVKVIFCGNFSNISVQIYTLSSWEPKSTLCKQNVHTLYSFYSWFWVKAILCWNFAIYFNFNFIQLIQSPSLQTRKEYKKWTNHQVAIVFMSPVLPAPPILDSSPRSILQVTQSSSSKQCQCLFSNFPYHPISYRLLQYPQPSNILNRQVANNACVWFSHFSCPPKSS